MEPSVGPVTLQGPGWVQNFAFRSLQISEALAAPFRYELELLSDDPKQDPKAILGQALTVCLDLGDAGIRYFNGYVTEFSSRGSIGEYFLYGMVLRPWLWLISRTSNCRVFQNLTVPDIVKQIFRKHGFSDFSESLTGSYDPREYVVQYRETDQHFVNRLLEEEGIYYFFKHEADKHTLVLCDSPSAHDPTPFYESLPYYPPARGRQEHLDHADRWEITSVVESAAYALKDFDFEKPKAPLLGDKSVDPGHDQGTYEVFDYPGGHKEVAPATAKSLIRLDELRSTWLSAHGEGNAPGLAVGQLFTLAEFPIEEHNHDYLVVSLEATLRSHELESGEANPGDLYRCRFVVIDSNQQYRPPRATAKPTVQGIQTAIVVGKSGEEIWTDEYGRVKIKFHWDRYVPKEEENASCWVRVAQLWAGTGFGGIHIPRMGQEVIVEFLEGDPDRPMIVGRVYNFDNKPPYDLPKNQTQSGIKSRSTKGGTPENFNEIRFEDKKGEEELYIHAEKTQTTKVEGSQGITVDGSRTVSVGGTQTTTVTGDESQIYKSNRKMEVTLANSDTIHKAHDGKFLTTRTQEVTGEDKLTVHAGRTTAVTAAYSITADGSYQVTNKDNIILLKGAGAAMTNGKCTISFDGADATLEAPGKLQLTAGAELTLVCGSTSLVMKSDGTVEIKGAQKVAMGSGPSTVACEPTGITSNGTKISSAAVGTHEITGAMIKLN